MIAGPIDPEQQRAARIAGFLYLLMMVTGVFAEAWARGSLLGGGERLFRFGTVSDLVTFAGDVVLLWALYVVLRPVNRNLALLAAFWRITECAILAVIMMSDFAAFRLLSGSAYLNVFGMPQLQALARFFVALQGDGYRIGLFFFGLGSTAFAYLWLRSRYIPRALAAWGIFSSLIVAIVVPATMIFPRLATALGPAWYVPIMTFEIALGFWLLIRGIRVTV